MELGNGLFDRPDLGSGREIRNPPPVFTSSIKRRIRKFYVTYSGSKETYRRCHARAGVVLLVKPVNFFVDLVAVPFAFVFTSLQ